MSARPWYCRRCASDLLTDGLDPVRFGTYFDPPSPSVRCADCDAPPPDSARVLAALALAQAAREAAPTRRRQPVAAGHLSQRAAARRLGIGRDTLARLVQAHVIAPVQKGARDAFRAADVERLIEHGYSLPDAPRPAAPAKRKRRRPEGNGAAPVKRISDLPY